MSNLKKFISFICLCWFCMCVDITGALAMEPMCPKLDNEYRTIETMLRTERYVKDMKKEMTEIQRDVSERFADLETLLNQKFVYLETEQNQKFADLKTEQNKLNVEMNRRIDEIVMAGAPTTARTTTTVATTQPSTTESTTTTTTARTTTTAATTQPSTTESTTTNSSDCVDILNLGFKDNDIYTIRLNSTNEAIKVLCDMETDRGGWTVFQYRGNGSVNFYRNFADYRNGFGDMEGEFWLGLEYIYELTRGGNTELRIDLTTSRNGTGYEKFDHFQLSDSNRQYTLSVSGSSGTISPADRGIMYNNRQPFSTFDNDRYNCAEKNRGGWWYDYCTSVNLNGHYADPGSKSGYKGNRWTAGMFYRSFDHWNSLKTSKMMLRRKTKSFPVEN